jgi:hypothetical protein
LGAHDAIEAASFRSGSPADKEAAGAVEGGRWEEVVGHFETDMKKDLHLHRAIRCPEGGIVRYSMVTHYEPWADDADDAPVVLSPESAARLEASLARVGIRWTALGDNPP